MKHIVRKLAGYGLIAALVLSGTGVPAVKADVKGAEVKDYVTPQPSATAEPSSIPKLSETPEPTPSILYHVFFYLDESNFTYDTGDSQRFGIRGRGFFCITDIYYGDEKLEADKDYFIENPYDESSLYFSKEFLDRLDIGGNKLKLEVYMNPSLGLATSYIEIKKVSKTETTSSPDLPAAPPEQQAPVNVTCETFHTGGVNQRYIIESKERSKPVKLSDLKLRFHYTKDDSKEQVFYCDSAGIQSSQAPYYVDYTDAVRGAFGEGYVDISFDTDKVIQDESMSFGIRFNQADWSSYTGFKAGEIEIIYDVQ